MQLSTTDVKIKKVSEKGNTAIFSFEPLPEGYGNTLGNALRRVLLTSIPGAAITQVKIANAPHQFSTLPGVKEDVVELTLNLKALRFKIFANHPVVTKLVKTGEGSVTAADIENTTDLQVVDKSQHIATLTDKKAKFDIEIVVEPGVGYSPIEDRETSKVGVILLDAMYSPVVRATFHVEPTRLGRTIGLDKLSLTIETDGSITPDEALTEASTQLRNFFGRFAKGEDEEAADSATNASSDVTDVEDVSIEELPLPTRTVNALKKYGVESLKELANKTDEDLADIKNLGEKSIEEIKKLLIKEGLR